MANKMLRSLTIDGTTYQNLELVKSYYSPTATTNIASNTAFRIDTETMPDDGYTYLAMGIASVRYGANPTGTRWLEIYIKQNDSYVAVPSQGTNALTGFRTYMAIPVFVLQNPNEPRKTIALNLFQNSGSTITAEYGISLHIFRVMEG